MTAILELRVELEADRPTRTGDAEQQGGVRTSRCPAEMHQRACRTAVGEAQLWRVLQRARTAGAELDLLIVAGNDRRGFEFKRSDTPKVARSMRVALDDLRLERLDIIYPGPDSFEIDKRVRAVALPDATRMLGKRHR